MRRLVASVWIVVAVAALAMPVEAQEGELRIESTDASGHPQVTALVTAPATADGSGFGAREFVVLEDDRAVEAEVERIDSADLEVMLVIDTSGSMDGAPLQAAKAAVGDFLEAMPAPVRVGAVSFGPTASLLAAPTTDRAQLRAAVGELFVSGETALYDALVFAAEQFGDAPSDRAMLVLSDGGDTASTGTLAAATSAVEGTRTDVIELVTNESNRPALDDIAAAGGGSVSSTDDPDALAGLYRLAAGSLTNRYRISYTSSGSGSVDLSVQLTAAPVGTLQDSTTLDLPVVEEPPTTESEADAEDAVAAPATAPIGPQGGARTTILIGGAIAVFGALLLLGLVVAGRDPDRRIVRAGLGLNRRTIDRDTAVKVKERLAGDLDRMLDRRGQRGRLESLLDVAGISLRSGEFVLLVAVATLVGALALFALFGVFGVVLAVVIGPVVARTVVRRRAAARRQQFADTLPGNLQLMTNALRSGYGLLQSIDAVAREAPEPARSEFRRVILETRVGRDLRDALHALAERMDSRDFDWVVGAMDINRDVGGDLAGVLDTVAETVRERQRVRRQIKTLTAEGRISAMVLTALPPGLAGLMALISPDYFDGLTTGAGVVAVGVGVALLGVGWLWMSRMIRIDY